MIDWVRIENLLSEVGPEDFREVVALFLEEVEEAIARLSTAPDPARLEQELHFLKGCALNLGFSGLGELCSRGESAAAAGRMGEIDLPAIFECFETSRSDFAAGVKTFGIIGM
jgi:HPt (histidine-containing phosphotransfer) domain-containing protein